MVYYLCAINLQYVVMRTKIDNLVLFNLCWLVLAVAYVWLQSKTMLFLVMAGGILTMLYSLYLFKRTSGHVEHSAQFRLRKRISLSALQSLLITILSLSFFLI